MAIRGFVLSVVSEIEQLVIRVKKLKQNQAAMFCGSTSESNSIHLTNSYLLLNKIHIHLRSPFR